MEYQYWAAALAIGLTIYAYIPYLKGIAAGKTKPHAFTWTLWSVMVSITCAVQFSDGAGVGLWPTIAAAFFTILITILAYRQPQKDITRADWAMFAVGLLAIPAWVVTSNALWAAVIASFTAAVAWGPTFRKSWNKPYEEVVLTYGMNAVRQILSVAAITNMTWANALYPATFTFMNGAICILLVLRRRVIAP